jgi:hypothetical protein
MIGGWVIKFRNPAFLAVAVLFAAVSCSATDIYFGPVSAGSNNGTSCANAYQYSDGTHGWSLSAQQAAGNNLHICSGTYAAAANGTLMTFVNSGSSSSPITLIADQGAATFQAPYFNTSNGAITNNGGQSYIVINGNSNLVIQNTANGTSLANHQASYGIALFGCSHCTVENTTIQNIYVNQGSNSGATDTNGGGTSGIFLNGTSTGAVISGNTVSQSKVAIGVSPDGGSPADASNVTISNNTVSDMDWGIFVGGGDSSDTMNNVVINGNKISNWTNWQYPASQYHQDGVMLYNVGNPSAGLTATLHDNYIYGAFSNGGSPTGLIYCADFTSCTIFNNLLVNTGTTSAFHSPLWLGQSENHGKNMSVYNNTMVNTNGSAGACVTLQITGTAVFENNICTGYTTAFASYLTSMAALQNTISSSIRNVWPSSMGSSAISCNVGGSGLFATFATWQGDGFDANSSTTNPNLTASYLIPSTSSSAYQIGADLTGLEITALDIDMAGNHRSSSGAWDAGAYLYSTSSSSVAPPTNLNAAVQ